MPAIEEVEEKAPHSKEVMNAEEGVHLIEMDVKRAQIQSYLYAQQHDDDDWES